MQYECFSEVPGSNAGYTSNVPCQANYRQVIETSTTQNFSTTAWIELNGATGTITFPMNANSGILSWGSQNASSCSLSDSSNGVTQILNVSNDLSGQEGPTTFANGISTFTINCTGLTNSSASIIVIVPPHVYPALTIAADSSNPPANNIPVNNTGDALAVYRLTETSNAEAVKVTQLTILDSVASSGVPAAFSNVQLYNVTMLLGTAQSPTWDNANSGYDYTFTSFGSPLVVPQGSSISIMLKGSTGSSGIGSTHTFSILQGGIVARGYASNQAVPVTLSNASGNPQTIITSYIASSTSQ